MTNGNAFSGNLKAIETVYNGYRFRSRLEARWAVFFGELGIEYEYEPEGYDLGKAGWYLPDFWLPDLKAWLEVKPNRRMSDEEDDKIEALHYASSNPVFLGKGEPFYGKLLLVCHDTCDSGGGINWWPAHWMIRPGSWVNEYADLRIGVYNPTHKSDRTWCTADWSFLSWVEDWDKLELCSGIEDAAIEARQARFEHGANG